MLFKKEIQEIDDVIVALEKGRKVLCRIGGKLDDIHEDTKDMLVRAEMDLATIRGDNRSHPIVNVRTIIAYDLRTRGYMLKDIAIYMNKNHTSIMHYINRYDDMMIYDDFNRLAKWIRYEKKI